MRKLLISSVFLSTLFVISVALAQPQPQRPVVLVPGILGSRLCEASSGELIWGNRASLLNFSKLEITGNSNDTPLKPCGIIQEIQILGSFWSIDQYNLLLSSLSTAGFSSEKGNLFIFDYDWRQSNIKSADLPNLFIRDKIGDNKDFDLIAHSMGGIIARIFVDKYKAARSLKRIIYLGTPFLGSMNTFGTIQEGWGWVQNRLAGGQEVIWRVALSFPAMLELLPRYDGCCYIRTKAGQRQPINVFDAETWRRLGWLPIEYNNMARYNRFAETLAISHGLTELLEQAAPNGITEVLFASDVHATLRRLGMKEGLTAPGDWYFSKERGDGTVPVWSAARRPDQDAYDNTLPSFAQHPTIFNDKWVADKVASTLLKISPSDPDPIGAPGRPSLFVTINGLAATWSVDMAEVLVSNTLAKQNTPMTTDLVIKLENSAYGVTAGAYLPTAQLNS